MFLLAIDWAAIGVKAAQFVLSFSILVILHELGHFLPARWFKCRVEKFYLFFNPWFSLVKKKIGETEYGLGWIPLGGYVKISGMIDESMDKQQMKQPPQPWEFRSKPAWQRLIIMLGGVTVNIILALIIFIAIAFVWGDTYVPAKNLRYGVYADTLGRKMGLQDGDKIIAVGDEPVQKMGDVTAKIASKEPKSITIDRNGQKLELAIPQGLVRQLTANRLRGFSIPRYPAVIDTATEKFPAKKGEIHRGDKLIGIDGKPVYFNTDFIPFADYESRLVTLTFLRDDNDTVNVKVQLDKSGFAGLSLKSPGSVLGSEHVSYSFFESIPAGINRCFSTLKNYIMNLKQLFVSKEVRVRDSLGSVLSIGNVFPGVWDWESFWTLTAIFSIILAFMNVLPVPGLDGGHALFTLYEMISGRKPSDKFIEYAQMVGMVLLLALMLYAFGLDIWRIFK